MTFIPNNTGTLRRSRGTNIYGEHNDLGPPELVPCGIVKLLGSYEKTSVRADSTASRGTAVEEVILSKILFLPSQAPRIDDQFEVAGLVLKCVGVHPRYSILGKLDHHECDFDRWPQ